MRDPPRHFRPDERRLDRAGMFATEMIDQHVGHEIHARPALFGIVGENRDAQRARSRVHHRASKNSRCRRRRAATRSVRAARAMPALGAARPQRTRRRRAGRSPPRASRDRVPGRFVPRLRSRSAFHRCGWRRRARRSSWLRSASGRIVRATGVVRLGAHKTVIAFSQGGTPPCGTSVCDVHAPRSGVARNRSRSSCPSPPPTKSACHDACMRSSAAQRSARPFARREPAEVSNDLHVLRPADLPADRRARGAVARESIDIHAGRNYAIGNTVVSVARDKRLLHRPPERNPSGGSPQAGSLEAGKWRRIGLRQVLERRENEKR